MPVYKSDHHCASKLPYSNRQIMTIVESEKLPPEEPQSQPKPATPSLPQKKEFLILGGLVIFCIFLYFLQSIKKTIEPNQDPHYHNLSIWACLPPYPDPVKVTVPSTFDYADIKKALKSELTPRLDTKSLGEILLLTPLYGKVDVTTKVFDSNRRRHKKGWKRSLDWRAETVASATQPLVVFVDDIGMPLSFFFFCVCVALPHQYI